MYLLTRVSLLILLLCVQIPGHVAHAELTDADAVAPILENVILVNGSYELTGYMPAGSQTPAGGFKTILNGSPQTDTSSQLNKTVSDLDTSQTHCFQLQARWTQFDPIKFRSSNDRCVEPAVDPAVARSPVLDKVTLQSGEYILTGHMPANSGTPEGGYKTILNGEPLTEVFPRLYRTLGDLDTSVYQCFQLQGRWTQFDPFEFRSSDEICIGPSPILTNSDISHDNGQYQVKAVMPGSAIPEGDYSLLVNGELRMGDQQQLFWTLNDLDPSIEQCFQVQADWTQIDSQSTSYSATRCIDPNSDSGMRAAFSSGFESDVSITGTAPNEVMDDAEIDLVGADSPGNDWQGDLEALPYVGAFSFNTVGGKHGTNFKIALARDPDAVNTDNNQVLVLENIEPVASDGRSAISRPQGTLSLKYDKHNPDASLYEFSVALDMFLDKEGFEHAESNRIPIGGANWFSIFEIWEHPGDNTLSLYDEAGRSRVSVYLEREAGDNKPLYFRAGSQITLADYFDDQWSMDSRDPMDSPDFADEEVPLGRWFTLKVYFKAGGLLDGRFRMSIIDNGVEKTVFDVENTTRNDDAPTAPSDLTAMKNYVSEDLMDLLRSDNNNISFKIYYDNFRFYEGELR